jgi:hypothetical protein
MEVLLDVISVVPREDNTLLLVFENKVERLFDMTPYLSKKPFIILNKLPLFMKARVEYGTVVWPGNIDISPETLWDCSMEVVH